MSVCTLWLTCHPKLLSQPTSDRPSGLNRLLIVETGTHRLLRNASGVDCLSASFLSAVTLWDYPREGDLTKTAAPCVEVRSLPAGHDVVVESIDPYEDGHLTFTLVCAEWADGRTERTPLGGPVQTIPIVAEGEGEGLSRVVAVAEALKAGRSVPEPLATPPRVEREIDQLDTIPSRVARGFLTGAPAPNGAEPATCMTCAHSVRAVALGLGIRCIHPANNPRREEGRGNHWVVPSREYRCPVHRPRADKATSQANL